MKKILIYALIAILGILILFTLPYLILRPSNDRNWSPDLALLPYADIHNNLVTIHNVRNAHYRTTSDFDLSYYDRTYDLNRLKKVWYMVEPFGDYAGPAHTFLSFEFDRNVFVTISIEVRRQVGEEFSMLRSLYRPYEITYVVADENDVLKLRSNYRKDNVFLYPIKEEKPGDIQKLFMDMISKVNDLKDQPEFYNLFTDTCTTRIVQHVNKVTTKSIPFSFKYLLPSYSDRLAYDLGLVDTNLSFEDARVRFQINERALKYANDPNWSVRVRQER